MESKRAMWISPMVLIAMLTVPTGLSARQEATARSQKEKQSQYKVFDAQEAPQEEIENGGFAVSAVTVVDGAYATNQIATVPENGGPYHFLTNLPNGAFDPVFSRSGGTIFFQGTADSGIDGVFSVPTEGGAVEQLQTDCITNPNCLGEGNPAVSPNGRELLEGRALGPIDENGCLAFGGIYLLRIDGSHSRQISETGVPCTSDFEPRWSPDGHRIVFQHQDLTGLFSIWVMRRDGSHRHQITPPAMDGGNPDWSPDGNRIVFQSPAEPAATGGQEGCRGFGLAGWVLWPSGPLLPVLLQPLSGATSVQVEPTLAGPLKLATGATVRVVKVAPAWCFQAWAAFRSPTNQC